MMNLGTFTRQTLLQHPRSTSSCFTRSLSHSKPVRKTTVVTAEADSDNDPPALMGDWRSFRAKLVASDTSDGANAWSTRVIEANRQLLEEQNPSLAQEDFWAHPGVPEIGGILVASSKTSDVVGKQFWQVVVFLLEHGPDGSAGLILNRPTSLNLGRLGRMFPDSMPDSILTDFAACRLYTGGFEAQRLVAVLHGHKELPGSTEVVPGIYLGTHDSALHGVSTHGFNPSDFKFFAGCVAWAPGELQRQIEQGAWHSAACSRALVLKQCLTLPVPLWVEVMKLMGDEFAVEAQRAYGDISNE